MSIRNDLAVAVTFIEVNREDLGDKKALDMLLKGIKRIVKEESADE